jgi:YbgC/YbaW family acyl-CoA thioester hydrolase
MSTPSFIWQTKIRFVDTDASGRIHYAAMFRHFEAAEFEFMHAIGHPYTFVQDDATDLRYPRVHVECDYLAALRCDDGVAIHVTVEKVGRASYTLGFVAMKEGVRAAAGRIVAACMHAGTLKAHELPADFAHALRARIAG